jgi:hypothetical protein
MGFCAYGNESALQYLKKKKILKKDMEESGSCHTETAIKKCTLVRGELCLRQRCTDVLYVCRKQAVVIGTVSHRIGSTVFFSCSGTSHATTEHELCL